MRSRTRILELGIMAVPPVAGPVNTVAPVLSLYNDGFDDYLTWNNGTWTGSPTSYSYELWDITNNVLLSTSAPDYFVSAYGYDVRVKVTATNGDGSTAAWSNTETL